MKWMFFIIVLLLIGCSAEPATVEPVAEEDEIVVTDSVPEAEEDLTEDVDIDLSALDNW